MSTARSVGTAQIQRVERASKWSPFVAGILVRHISLHLDILFGWAYPDMIEAATILFSCGIGAEAARCCGWRLEGNLTSSRTECRLRQTPHGNGECDLE